MMRCGFPVVFDLFGVFLPLPPPPPLPTSVAGTIGRLRLTVPWANLKNEHVVLHLDNVYALLAPDDGTGGNGGGSEGSSGDRPSGSDRSDDSDDSSDSSSSDDEERRQHVRSR